MRNQSSQPLFSSHVFIYIITLIVSIILLLCVFIEDKNLSTVLVSIGAGGFASSLLGIIIEISNSKKIKYLRKTNLETILHSYLSAISSFLSCSFQIIINVFEKVPNNATYKITIKEFINVIEINFPAFDQAKYLHSKGELVYIDKSQEDALTILTVFNRSLKHFATENLKLTSQDMVGLLSLYNEHEIRSLKYWYDILIGPCYTLEEYYYLFEGLTEESLYKILGIKNINDFTFYYENKKYALVNDKEILCQNRTSRPNFIDAISFTEALSNKKDEA